jgi:O-antigen/teichoic acid export membrane protein
MTTTAMLETREGESIFRPALVLMSGRVLAFAATFFIPVVLARVFAPAEFGTYKQLFLIFSTVYYIAQFGMASSLYYFLPQAHVEPGRYAANAALFLALSGLACIGALQIGSSKVAQWLSNTELPAYLPWIGLYLFLMLLSAAMEMIMISRGRYLWASVSYAVSDLARAAAFILPALLFRQLDWLLKGAVLVAGLRAVGTFLYLRREFGGGLRPDAALLKDQLRYAVPFGMAVLVEILQTNFHQYAVSNRFDPATFAIYAVGCLQIPFVDFVATPTSDVMMVKMRERLSEGRNHAVLDIWHGTTRKLALLFFPLSGLAMVTGREIIVSLFTEKYVASTAVFVASAAGILFAAWQVDGVLRVYAETRFLLMLNLVRLILIATLIGWFLSQFRLVGPVLVTLLATLAGKVLALARIQRLMKVAVAGLLPWRCLAALLGSAAGAAVVALVVRAQLRLPAPAVLVATASVYATSYVVSVWGLDLVTPDEKSALLGWMKRATGVSIPTLEWRER